MTPQGIETSAEAVALDLETGPAMGRVIRLQSHAMPSRYGKIEHRYTLALVQIDGEEAPRWIDSSRVALLKEREATCGDPK